MCVAIGTVSAASMAAYSALATSVIGAGVSAVSAIQQGKSSQAVAQYNARQSEIQAQDARARGGIEANQRRQQAKQVIATQQTQLAANGVQLGSGSALNLVADTAWEGEMDAQTANVNAMREAFGYQTQATSYRLQGANAKKNAYGSAFGSLLSGAGSAFGVYGSTLKERQS